MFSELKCKQSGQSKIKRVNIKHFRHNSILKPILWTIMSRGVPSICPETKTAREFKANFTLNSNKNCPMHGKCADS